MRTLSQPSLRVVFWNTRGLNQTKRRIIFNTLSNRFADLFIVCETWGMHRRYQDGLEAMLVADTPPSLCAGASGREKGGLAVFSHPNLHKDLSHIQSTEHSLSVALRQNVLTAVYLPPSLSEEQTQGVMDKLPHSEIIVGDFNCRFLGVNGATENKPADRGRMLARWCAASNMRVHQGADPISQIDHLLLSMEHQGDAALRHIAAEDMGDESDHAALRFQWHMRTQTPCTAPAQRRRHLCLRHLDHEHVCDQLGESFDAVAPLIKHLFQPPFLSVKDDEATSQHAINMAAECLADLVWDVAAAVLGEYDAVEVRQEKDKTFEKLGQCRTRPDVSMAFKRMQRSAPKARLLSRDVTCSPGEDVLAYYTALFSAPPSDLPLPTLPFTPPPHLSVPMANALGLTSIQSWAKEYPKSKAPGPDCMYARLFGVLCEHSGFPLLVRYLFQHIAITGLTPHCWNTSRIYLLPKKTEAETVMDFRPVSLTQMLRRCFESLWWIGVTSDPNRGGDWMLLSSLQAGFRGGYSTLTHVALVDELARSPATQAMVFVDFKNAYDLVPIGKLLHKIRLRGACDTDTRIIRGLMAQTTSEIVVNGSAVGPVVRHRGLLQGSVLAPILFNIFVDDLARNLEGVGRHAYGGPLVEITAASINETHTNPPPPTTPSALLFADDLALLPQSQTQAVGLINVLTSWTEANDMVISLPKCGFVEVAGCREEWLRNPGLALLHAIPEVTTYKYLGLPVTRRGVDWEAYVAYASEKASSTLQSMSEYSLTLPEWTKVHLVQTFVMPRVEYAAPLLWQWCARRHPAVHDQPLARSSAHPLQPFALLREKCLQWIFNTNNYKKILGATAGLLDINVRLSHLAARFAEHLRLSAPFNPVRILFPDRLPPPWPTDTIVPSLHNNLLYRRFLRETKGVRGAMLKEWLRRIEKQRLTEDNGLLGKAIQPNARGPTGLMDRVLYFQHGPTRRRAIAWRRNVYGLGAWCKPECGQRFRRTHVDSCGLLPQLPADITAEISPDPATLDASLPHLSRIDRLLNLHNEDATKLAFDHLDNLLEDNR